MFYLVESFNYDIERVECLHELVSYYCINKMNNVAYNYYLTVKNFYENSYLNSTMQGKLFLENGKYDLYLPYYMILVADKVQQWSTVIQMYRIIFTKKFRETSKFFIGNMLYNLQFFIDKVDKNDTHFFKLFKEYVDFLISIGYSVEDHNFMNKYEKYGIIVKNNVNPKFGKEECSKSNKILFYTGFSNVNWNYSYSINNALGGSETAVAFLANSLPTKYDVYISGNVEEEKYDNITYVNLHNLKNLINTTAFHTIIVSRYTGFYETFPNFSAFNTFIWGHDTVLNSYGCDKSVETILSTWSDKITGCICQTEWHKNIFLTQYPMLKDKIYIINNGIKISNVGLDIKKTPNRFVYSSCTERGLRRLLELWPTIIKNLPDAKLFISSYNNFPKNEEETKLLEIIENNEGITHLGKLNKTQLYELMKSCEYWLYTSYWQETSCITAMEMLMSETICLYYPIAGLVDTLGDYGVKISEGNEIETLLSLTNERKEELKKNGRIYAESCSWENRATKWSSVIFKEDQNNDENQYIGKKNNIKIINLKNRNDRKDYMIKQLNEKNVTNYDFFESINGNELKETDELRLLFEGNDFYYKKGIIGCALSHLHLLKTLVDDNDNEYYIILEDDIELLQDFKEKLNIYCKLFEENKLEHLSLGIRSAYNVEHETLMDPTNEVTVFEKDVFIKHLQHITHAYIISKNAAKKIISFINKCSIKMAYDSTCIHGNVLSYHQANCCIVRQTNIDEFGSDIQFSFEFFYSGLVPISKIDIRISFCDWWSLEYCGGYFDVNSNFITDILKKSEIINNIVVVEPNENPDILFYSVFGNVYTKYPNVRKVFFSGEPFGIRPDADFNLTCNKNSDINTRFPLWLCYIDNYLLEECTRRTESIITVPKRDKFCSFISSNEFNTTHKKTIVEKLSKYKTVDCGGPYLNNIGYIVPTGTKYSGKIEHNNKYKFAIAIENEDYPGYVSEKICDIYKSNCVPIYWGTKEVVKDFNPTTFINANDFANIEDLVEYIIKVDNDDTLYASFFKEPMFSIKWIKWINILNKEKNIFCKNIASCIIGKNNKLLDNYFASI